MKSPALGLIKIKSCALKCLPYASSIRAQYGLMPDPFCLASCSPSLRMFSRPFRDTCTIFESITVSKSHMGLIAFWDTRYLSTQGHMLENEGKNGAGQKLIHMALLQIIVKSLMSSKYKYYAIPCSVLFCLEPFLGLTFRKYSRLDKDNFLHVKNLSTLWSTIRKSFQRVKFC